MIQMGNKDDLEYTADGIRDTKSQLGKDTDPNSVTASMAEEVAKAQHRTAEAIEELSGAISSPAGVSGDGTILGRTLRKMAVRPGGGFTPPLLIGVDQEEEAQVVAEDIQDEYGWHDQSKFVVIGHGTIGGPIAQDGDLSALAEDHRIDTIEVDGYGHTLDE